MTGLRCCCGYTPTADYTLDDHIGEMFIPADDIDTTGQPHAETSPGSCLCGYLASNAAALDEHLLASFIPTGHLALDGHKHNPAEQAPGCAAVR